MTERDVVAHAGKLVLGLGALGVVYGDLGTSPLYTMQVLFNEHAKAVHPTPEGVYGVISLIFWALIIIVSAKYAGLIMRVHNRGDVIRRRRRGGEPCVLDHHRVVSVARKAPSERMVHDTQCS